MYYPRLKTPTFSFVTIKKDIAQKEISNMDAELLKITKARITVIRFLLELLRNNDSRLKKRVQAF